MNIRRVGGSLNNSICLFSLLAVIIYSIPHILSYILVGKIFLPQRYFSSSVDMLDFLLAFYIELIAYSLYCIPINIPLKLPIFFLNRDISRISLIFIYIFVSWLAIIVIVYKLVFPLYKSTSLKLMILSLGVLISKKHMLLYVFLLNSSLIAFSLLKKKDKKILKILVVLTCLLVLFILFLLGRRGFFLFFLLSFYFLHRKFKLTKFNLTLLILLIVYILLILYLRTPTNNLASLFIKSEELSPLTISAYIIENNIRRVRN